MSKPKFLITSYRGIAVREYLDKSRISHKVDKFILNNQLLHFAALLESSTIDHSYFIGRLLYRHARHCFRHGDAECGERSLSLAREVGFRGHSGSIKHKLFFNLLGLRLKEYLSIKLRSPEYYD